MKDIVVIGAGAFGREVVQLIKDINKDRVEWNLLGFIDETSEKQGTAVNNTPVLGGFEWFDMNPYGKVWAVCAVGSAKGKQGLVNKAKMYNISFANLVHPSVGWNDSVKLGVGNIICWNSFLSVDVVLGDHVAINPGCGIGHDTVIRDYSTLYWNVTLSGNVTINEGCEIGSKAVVIQQRTVGEWSIVGAGAAVIRDIPEKCTAVGVPAKPIKFM